MAYEMLPTPLASKPATESSFMRSAESSAALLRLAQFQGAEVFVTASSKRHDELRPLAAVPFDYASKD
jgi:hypothetical protein